MLREFIKTKYALLAIVGVGLTLTIAIIELQPPMKHDLQERLPVAVSVVEAQQHNIRPAIFGFGTVMPDLILEAKSEVQRNLSTTLRHLSSSFSEQRLLLLFCYQEG